MRAVIWLVAISVVMSNLGCFYSHDVPQELSDELIITFGVSQEQLNMLYSAYSISNIFLGPLAAQIIDLVGVGVMNLIATGCIFFGNLLIFLGAEFRSYNYIISGRIIFGLGGELAVAATFTIIERYFKGGLMSLVSSMVQCSIQVGVSMSNFISYPSFKYTRTLRVPFFLATCMCGVSCIFSAIYSVIETTLGQKKLENAISDLYEDGSTSTLDGRMSAADSLSMIIGSHGKGRRKFSGPRVALSDNGHYFREVNSIIEDNIQHIEEVYVKRTVIQRLQDLNTMFILAVIMTGLSTVVYFQFLGISTEFLTKRYGIEIEKVKNYISISVLSLVPEIPIIGYLINNFGGKIYAVVIASLMLILSGTLFYILPFGSEELVLIPLFFMTQFYAFVAVSAVPLVSLSLPSRSVGFGVGLAIMLENLGLTIMPVIIGKMLQGYDKQQFNNISLGAICIGFINIGISLLLLRLDKKHGGFLNMAEIDERVEEIRRELFDLSKEDVQFRTTRVRSMD